MRLWQKVKCFFGFHKWNGCGYSIGDKTWLMHDGKWCICGKMKDFPEVYHFSEKEEKIVADALKGSVVIEEIIE